MDFLIDACIWIDVERELLAPADLANIRERAHLSVSNHYRRTPVQRRACSRTANAPGRLAALHRIRRKPLIVVDAVTADIFGSLAAISAAGRQHCYRVQDLWLA